MKDGRISNSMSKANGLGTKSKRTILVKGEKIMDKVIFDAGHIFAHYLEVSIPNEEWERMTVEGALGIAKDIGDLFSGNMSTEAFAKKYRLPRKK